MSKFVWNDSYAIGDALTDQQHKEFFNLANQILSAKDHDASINSVMLLYKHIREHFKQEETFMKQQAYPGYEAHVNVHNDLLALLTNLSQQFHVDAVNEPTMEKFMAQWIDHICVDDVAVKDFLVVNNH